MEWTVNELRNYFQELANTMPVKLVIDTPIYINTRFKTCLGRVTATRFGRGYKPTKIDISKKLLECYSDEDIKQVLKHEFCHYYLFCTDEEQHGHDRTFKELCHKIDCKFDGTKADLTPIRQPKQKTSKNTLPYKYKLVCSCCGETIGYRKRMCPIIKHSEEYLTECCGEPLEVIEL